MTNCEELVSHQIEHLAINEANYFMYQWAGHAMRCVAAVFRVFVCDAGKHAAAWGW